jgi:hypothetical protein
MDDDGLLDEIQEDLGADYSPQLRLAAGMLSGDAQAAVPYLLFSIAKSLEDISFLLSNDSVSVVMETDEDDSARLGRAVLRRVRRGKPKQVQQRGRLGERPVLRAV